MSSASSPSPSPVPSSRVEKVGPVQKPARYAVRGSGFKVDPRADTRAPKTQRNDSKRRRLQRPFAAEVRSEFQHFGSQKEIERLEGRLRAATRAYEQERYGDTASILRELKKWAPGVASVRELYGLTLYRLGRWKDACRELEAFAEMSGSFDQYPVMADCERALGRHDRVSELWGELRQAGAGSDVLAEGRVVMAGSLADRGRVQEAIKLLEPVAARAVRKPLDRHLRQWYMLADLFERSGDLPRARELFQRIVMADSELSDVAERLAALR